MTVPPVRVVLLRPRNPENLGAVARALKNFGLSDWAIVDLGTHDFASARRVAVHSEEILDRPRLCSSIDQAVGDCAWVVGTSPRAVRGRRRLAPAEVADQILQKAPARTALVFGDERSGLSNHEILRCHDLSAVPTDRAQPSLNLAQAVLLYCYAIRERALAAGRGSGGPRPAPASDSELVAVEDALRDLLRGGGFLVEPERHALRDLADTLRRAHLSRREAQLWIAALKGVGRRLTTGIKNG